MNKKLSICIVLDTKNSNIFIVKSTNKLTKTKKRSLKYTKQNSIIILSYKDIHII